MGLGDWGWGIGDWGLGIGPNPQSPIPNPQSPIPIIIKKILNVLFFILLKIKIIKLIYFVNLINSNDIIKKNYYLYVNIITFIVFKAKNNSASDIIPTT